MKLPVLIPECGSPEGVFCSLCRSRDGHGKAFRETILRLRKLESVPERFECPLGRPWGWTPPKGSLKRKAPRVASRGLGDILAALFKAVGIKQKPGCGCKRRQEELNTVSPTGVLPWLLRKLAKRVRRSLRRKG